jgi:phospholipid transport system substrate-binding protein
MKTTRRQVLGLLAMAGCMTLSMAAGAGAGAVTSDRDAPEHIIRSTSSQIKTLLQEDGARIDRDPAYVYRMADQIFLPHVDMTRISTLVLGRHWRKASESQKEAFSEEFKRLLVRTYATALRELGDWEIEFGQTRMDNNDKRALVQTRVLRAGAQPLAVDYRMHRKAGRWLTYDVKIEGISLITNYRTSFDRTVRMRGLDHLIDELSAKNNAKKSAPGDQIAANGAAK